MVIPGAGKFSAILTAKTFLGYKGINLYSSHIRNPEFSITWYYSSALGRRLLSARFHFMALILVTGR